MTQIRIRQVVDGEGDAQTATCSIKLVDANGTPVVGWQTATETLLMEYREFDLNADTIVTLIDQADLEIKGGGVSYYRIGIHTDNEEQEWDITVLASGSIVELYDLLP